MDSLKQRIQNEVNAPTQKILKKLNTSDNINKIPRSIIKIHNQLKSIESNIKELNNQYKTGLTGTNNGYKTITITAVATVVLFITDAVTWGLSEGNKNKEGKGALNTLKWVFGGITIGLGCILTVVSFVHSYKKRKQKALKQEVSVKDFTLLLDQLSEFVGAIDLLKHATEDMDERLKDCLTKYDELNPKVKKQIPAKGKWVPLLIEQLPENDELKTSLNQLKMTILKEEDQFDKITILKEEDQFNNDSNDEQIRKEFHSTQIEIPCSEDQEDDLQWESLFQKDNQTKIPIFGERGLTTEFIPNNELEENSIINFWQKLNKRTDNRVENVQIGNRILKNKRDIQSNEIIIEFDNEN